MTTDLNRPQIRAVQSRSTSRRLYKFMTADTAKIVLADRTLRWSTPKLMNDVYDVQFNLRSNYDRTALLERVLEICWEIISGRIQRDMLTDVAKVLLSYVEYAGISDEKNFRRHFGSSILKTIDNAVFNIEDMSPTIQSLVSRKKILSLTEDPYNPVMWSHYAGNDTGVVIRLRSPLGLFTSERPAVRVHYVTEIPNLLDFEQAAMLVAGIHQDLHKSIVEKMVYTKGSAWSYEKEWRIFADELPNSTGPYQDIPFMLDEVDGVVLGINMRPNDRAEISKLASKLPYVELMQAKKSSSSLAHAIVKL